jgi:rhodanese-related sulfurtransferase
MRTPTFTLFAIPFVMFFGCNTTDGTHSLDPKAFQQALASPGVQLIDVRTPAEYAEGHLEGAMNLDWTGGVLEQRMGSLDKTRPVMLYCASGRRSAAAREAMIGAGFANVQDLDGGIHAWSSADLPLAH